MRISIAAAALACSSAFWGAPAQAQGYYVEPRAVYVRPPPPRPEAGAPHRRGHIWVPGHWEWRGRGHTWVPGHYLAARSGYYYEQPRWEQQGDRWLYRSGRWAKGDRDGDGVPNRFDRDRDGDGVRNRFDRAPDNPYRR